MTLAGAAMLLRSVSIAPRARAWSGGVKPIKWWLALVAFACLSGAIALGVVTGWFMWTQVKKDAGLSLLATSRAMAGAVDREIDQAVAIARGLVLSDALSRDDLASFERKARETLRPYGYELTLTAVNSGRQLINTQLPPGTVPDLPIAPDWVTPQTMAGGMTVKPLTQSRVRSGIWIVPVQVPAKISGSIRYVIDILIPTNAFQSIIAEQRFPDAWQGVIIDHDWTITARLVDPARYVGQQSAQREMLSQDPQPDSIHEASLLGGDFFLAAWSRSPRYGWTASIGIPEGALFWQSFGQIAVPVVVVLLLSSLIILVLGTLCFRLVRSIQTLAGAADRLGTSAPLEVPRFFVRELDNVGHAMAKASEQLGRNREQLETRIRETTEKLNREAEDRRKLEAEIAHSQRLDALGRLTGGVAHDFNNLLTVIMGNLEVIARTASAERREQLCSSALRAAGRGARLVKALLAFARKEPALQVTVDPNIVIEEFANVLKGALGDAVTLQLRLSPTVHACCLDPAQLQTALLNLATNARDAMPNGGQLAITTENAAFLADSDATINRAFSLPDGSYVRISVRDNGTGMTSGTVERAVEPFFTTKEVGSGSGLGLAQVYGFVKQSGGEINIESEIGQGTTISLYFPRAIGSMAEHDNAPAVTAEKNQPRQSIMVVDDDPDVRAVLIEQLEFLGYAVVSARDGQEALAKLRRGDRVDIVLSDYQMPNGLSGRDLVHRIREIAPNTKVVLISGFIASDPRLADLGVPVLGKPIRSDELGKAIREVSASAAS